MAPVVLARAGLRYALKIHGSDLSYTVLPELERFGPYAEEAVAGANGILVGSGHIADRLSQAVDDPETNAKVRLGPPGVDTDLFAPIPAAKRSQRLSELAGELRATARRRTADQAAPRAWRRRGGARRQDPPAAAAPPGIAIVNQAADASTGSPRPRARA